MAETGDVFDGYNYLYYRIYAWNLRMRGESDTYALTNPILTTGVMILRIRSHSIGIPTCRTTVNLVDPSAFGGIKGMSYGETRPGLLKLQARPPCQKPDREGEGLAHYQALPHGRAPETKLV
jgi:hypothetical protein